MIGRPNLCTTTTTTTTAQRGWCIEATYLNSSTAAVLNVCIKSLFQSRVCMYNIKVCMHAVIYACITSLSITSRRWRCMKSLFPNACLIIIIVVVVVLLLLIIVVIIIIVPVIDKSNSNSNRLNTSNSELYVRADV